MAEAEIVQCPSCGAKNRLRGSVEGAAPTANNGVPRCGRCTTPLPWLLDVSDTTFEREVGVAVPVLVDLWAPWCGPCRMVAPVLEELARAFAGRLKVVKVNVDQNSALARRFNARSIPMLLLLKDGAVAETVVGVRPKAELEQLLQRHL